MFFHTDPGIFQLYCCQNFQDMRRHNCLHLSVNPFDTITGYTEVSVTNAGQLQLTTNEKSLCQFLA